MKRSHTGTYVVHLFDALRGAEPLFRGRNDMSRGNAHGYKHLSVRFYASELPRRLRSGIRWKCGHASRYGMMTKVTSCSTLIGPFHFACLL